MTELPNLPTKGRNAQKLLWALLIAVIVLGFVWETVDLNDASTRMSRIPMEGLGFAGKDLELTEAEQDIFGEAHVINRVYVAGGTQYSLIVIDGSKDRHAVHDPMYCFKGSGWTVEAQDLKKMSGGEGKHLKLKRDGEHAEALIWYSDGREKFASPWKYWWRTTLRRISLGKSGDEPVLIILQPGDGDGFNIDKAFADLPLLRAI